MSWSRGNIELFTLIEEVVVAMRETNAISNVAASGNNYRYTATNTLTKNDYVSITYNAGTTDNLRIISADSTGFVLSENIPTASTFTANAPYFMHEKIARASEIFAEKESKGKTVSWQKYPLVLLVHSYPQNQDSSDFAYSATFDIFIITDSEQEYRSEDRYDNNITPTLIPIQESLIQGLSDSTHTKINNPSMIDKVWEDLLFIENNPFTDKLDGIKLSISGLEILDNSVCSFTTPDTFDITTSITPVGGGTINSNPTTLTGLAKNQRVNVNATANDYYDFVSLTIKDVLYYNSVQSFLTTQADEIVATFEYIWSQWVFGDTIQKIVDKWYFVDQTPNTNNVQIKNTQIGVFNGSVWISINMTGRTILSYESDGSAIPTKTSDSRIDVSAGNLYSITLDNGLKATINEGYLDCIFFTNGLVVVLATLENVVLATFWGTKSEYGTPQTVIKGETKYLICSSAGITALDVTGGTGTPIEAYGEWEGLFKRVSAIASDYLAVISDGVKVNIQNQGYLLFLQSTGLIAIRKGVTGAFLLQSPVGYLSIGITYKYKLQRNKTENQYFTGAADSMRLLIMGGVYADWTVVDSSGGGSNPFVDSTYTTYKYQSFNLTLSTEISHLSKDDIKIDVSDFNTITGTFGAQHAMGLNDNATDVKGNELEIPANVVSNSGNTFDGLIKTGIETDATYADIYALTDDANTEIIKTTNETGGYVSDLKLKS